MNSSFTAAYFSPHSEVCWFRVSTSKDKKTTALNFNGSQVSHLLDPSHSDGHFVVFCFFSFAFIIIKTTGMFTHFPPYAVTMSLWRISTYEIWDWMSCAIIIAVWIDKNAFQEDIHSYPYQKFWKNASFFSPLPVKEFRACHPKIRRFGMLLILH